MTAPAVALPPGPVVAFTATDRPAYLRDTLDSWRAVRGIETANLIFRCEPGFPDVEAICRKADFGQTLTVAVNPRRYGALTNPWAAIETAFAMTARDFVILGEDDSPVSTDVLEYYSWAEEAYRGDQNIIAVCAHVQHAHGGIGEVFRDSHFTCWVWGTWRDRWADHLRADWDHDYRFKGWDWRITEHWCQEMGFRALKPCLSRSQDIGEFGGVHARPEDFPAAVSTCFTADIPPQDYKEIAA